MAIFKQRPLPERSPTSSYSAEEVLAEVLANDRHFADSHILSAPKSPEVRFRDIEGSIRAGPAIADG